MLNRAGFMDEFGKERLFPSIEDAVTFASGGNRVVSKMTIQIFTDIYEIKYHTLGALA